MTAAETEAGQAIATGCDALAAAVAGRHYAHEPSLRERYGSAGFDKCVKDAAYHLEALAESMLAGSAALFADYARWAAALLASRNIPTADLVHNLRCIREVLADELAHAQAEAAEAYVDEALHTLGAAPTPTPEAEAEEEALRVLGRSYLAALLDGDRVRAREVIMKAVAAGTPVRQLYMHVLQWAQHEIGRRWQANRLTVGQEHLATAITQQMLAQLAPYRAAPAPDGRTFVMVCVEDEQHDLGARMVADFMEMEGWQAYYLGANVPRRDVVDAVKQYRAQVLGISATMTFHLSAVAALIRAVRDDPACADVVILVGGYPFNVDPEVWRQLGADGCAHSAETAAQLAERLMGGQEGVAEDGPG